MIIYGDFRDQYTPPYTREKILSDTTITEDVRSMYLSQLDAQENWADARLEEAESMEAVGGQG